MRKKQETLDCIMVVARCPLDDLPLAVFPDTKSGRLAAEWLMKSLCYAKSGEPRVSKVLKHLESLCSILSIDTSDVIDVQIWAITHSRTSPRVIAM